MGQNPRRTERRRCLCGASQPFAPRTLSLRWIPLLDRHISCYKSVIDSTIYSSFAPSLIKSGINLMFSGKLWNKTNKSVRWGESWMREIAKTTIYFEWENLLGVLVICENLCSSPCLVISPLPPFIALSCLVCALRNPVEVAARCVKCSQWLDIVLNWYLPADLLSNLRLIIFRSYILMGICSKCFLNPFVDFILQFQGSTGWIKFNLQCNSPHTK